MTVPRLLGCILLFLVAGVGSWTSGAVAWACEAAVPRDSSQLSERDARLPSTVQLDSLAIIRGRVTARSSQAPIASAHLILALADTTLHVVTGDSGTFVFTEVPVGEHLVTVEAAGYQVAKQRVVVDSGAVEMAFLLVPLAARLETLVPTAAGPERRRDLGGAVTVIDADSIVQTTPVATVTELLEGRVPGLTVQHTSGAPGDPARLRLRGIGSVLRSNDPVVIVDGVRIYAAQTERRSGNLTNLDPAADSVGTSLRVSPFDVPSPSPLDQIDPTAIETIEVVNGPSAATLYGADAANGVIIITTKRGQPGPARWQASLSQGWTTNPIRYPTATFRWGHDQTTDAAEVCAPFDATCIQDSVVHFQALNDPALTPFGQGRATQLSLATAGGSSVLTYHLAGSYQYELGPLVLPTAEIERFGTVFNQDPPKWMQRPHRLERWQVTSRVRAALGPTAEVTLSTLLSQTEQRRSSLEQQLAVLMGTYADAANGVYYRPSPSVAYLVDQTSDLVPNYYIEQTATTLAFTNAATAAWRPRPWASVHGTVGLDLVSRTDGLLLPASMVSLTDSGARVRGTGRSLVGTFDLQGDVERPLGSGFALRTSAGANLTTGRTDDLVLSARQLLPATNSISNASLIYGADFGTNASVYGYWLEPRLTGPHFAMTAGLRLDGGSTYGPAGGSGLGRLVSLPALNASWVVSEEPWFPWRSFLSSLRVRGAYGQAEVQPGVTDRLRLYADSGTSVGSQLLLAAVGNTDIRPERSQEFEGGIDADLLGGRASVALTAYRQRQRDALMPVQLPPSVQSGGLVLSNVGEVRNTGLEVTLGVTPLRSPTVTWTAQLQYARNHNRLVTLGEGVLPDSARGLVAGYPLYGRWARPILGYDDQNADGVLQPDEVQVGDSLAYLGPLLPTSTAALFSSVTLFDGAVGVTAGFTYDDGATQVDQAARTNWVLQPALGDPSQPLSEQAAAVAATRPADPTDFGLIHKVSTFRFQSLSIQYRVPRQVARLVRAQRLTVALQGVNLARHSTYQGRDPDVTGWSAGESIVDTGSLPPLRRWQMAVHLAY